MRRYVVLAVLSIAVVLLEGERGDLDVEVFAAFTDHRVRAPHEAARRLQRAAGRIREGFARGQLRLLANHIVAADLFGATVPVRDDPVTTNQLHRLIAFVGDAHGVLKVPVTLERLRMFRGVLGLDLDTNVVRDGF